MGWFNRFKDNKPENQEEEINSLADQRQSFLDSLKVDLSQNHNNVNTCNNNNDNNNSAFPDSTEKGDEYDEPRHTTQEENVLESDAEEMDMNDEMEL